MKFDMVVSDFDWTLGLAPDFIDSSTVDAIKDYQSRGGRFVVCTGREMSSIRNILLKYGFKGDFIASQGAVVANVESGDRSLSTGLDYCLASEVIEYFNTKDVTVVACNEDGLIVKEMNDYVVEYQRLTMLKSKVVGDLKDYILREKKIVHKLVCVVEPSLVKDLIADCQNSFGDKILVNSGAKYLVEVINPLYSKGDTTLLIAQKHGIEPSKVMVIGDSSNDIALFKEEFYKVAVGDACDELKSLADEVAVEFKKNPVKQMLDKYCR